MVGAAAGRMTLKAVRQRPDLERARHVQPFAPHARHAERGVDQHRPDRADEDHEDRGDGAVLDGVERERHPGERRHRLQDLDEGIERAIDQRRHADQEAERHGHQRRQAEAQQHAAQRIGELDADALVVAAAHIERIAAGASRSWRRCRPASASPTSSRVAAAAPTSLAYSGSIAAPLPAVGMRGDLPDRHDADEDQQRQQRRPQAQRVLERRHALSSA